MRLSSDEYDKIAGTIADLYEDYGICSFPVDVINLCHLMNLNVIFKSSLSSEKKDELDKICGDRDAFKFVKDGKIYIYINDVSFNERHQRFSIAHELGHYVLGHQDYNEKTESEANYFARYLLAPACISMHKKFSEKRLCSTYWLEEMAGLTWSAASYALSGFEGRIAHGPPLLDYEKNILEIFDSSLTYYLSK